MRIIILTDYSSRRDNKYWMVLEAGLEYFSMRQSPTLEDCIANVPGLSITMMAKYEVSRDVIDRMNSILSIEIKPYFKQKYIKDQLWATAIEKIPEELV